MIGNEGGKSDKEYAYIKGELHIALATLVTDHHPHVFSLRAERRLRDMGTDGVPNVVLLNRSRRSSMATSVGCPTYRV